MKLISSINGEGWLRVGAAEPTPARYLIGVWRDPNGLVFGTGRILGAFDAMCRAALQGGLVPLVLGDGRAIGVIVTERGASDDWGRDLRPESYGGRRNGVVRSFLYGIVPLWRSGAGADLPPGGRRVGT